MAGTDVVQLFEKGRPVCVMAQMALERMLAPEAVDKLFHDVAERQYERNLLFSSLAKLMASVVLLRSGSVRAAHMKMQAELGVSLNATYMKLDHIELGLSQAMVRYSYAQLKSVTDHLQASELSPVLGFHPKILDGNHLAGTEHRLRETRGTTASPLPGKTLVVLDPLREAIADLFPIEDGHAQERSGLDAVIETVAADDLWIADRNFCTLKFLYSIAGKDGRFAIRLHDQIRHALCGAWRDAGKTDSGRVCEGSLTLPEYAGKTLTVRCIELHLNQPTRDEERTIRILTNLTPNEADAVQVAEIYRSRWRIETAFQKLTTTLQCEVNTLCYPKAAIFAFSIACLAYNAVSMVLATVRAEHGKEKTAGLSFHYLAMEIAQTHDGMMVAVPPTHWDKVRRLSLAEFAESMRKVSQSIDFKYFRKAKTRPRKPKPKIKHKRSKVHVSVAKILDQRKH